MAPHYPGGPKGLPSDSCHLFLLLNLSLHSHCLTLYLEDFAYTEFPLPRTSFSTLPFKFNCHLLQEAVPDSHGHSHGTPLPMTASHTHSLNIALSGDSLKAGLRGRFPCIPSYKPKVSRQ